jgi:tripartite-type tricarboxylate transporter receptor subunit TctC
MLATAAVIALWCNIACAQTYPGKPVRVLVGFPPGGSTDIVARVVAERWGAQLGQPMIVENRPGAGGVIGLDAVTRSLPDGYTVGLLASPTLISALVNGRSIGAEREYASIGLIYRQGFFILINPAVPEFRGVRTLADLIAVVKSNPGKINYGSIGVGSTGHLVGELMADRGGLQWTHIPYKGLAPLLQEVTAGLAPTVLIGGTIMDSRNSGGRIVALATTSSKREASAPEVPTLSESGFPGVDASSWGSFIAPVGLPNPVLVKLAADYKAAFDSPGLADKLIGFTPEYLAPQDVDALATQTLQLWGKVIKDAGIKP